MNFIWVLLSNFIYLESNLILALVQFFREHLKIFCITFDNILWIMRLWQKEKIYARRAGKNHELKSLWAVALRFSAKLYQVI